MDLLDIGIYAAIIIFVLVMVRTYILRSGINIDTKYWGFLYKAFKNKKSEEQQNEKK